MSMKRWKKKAHVKKVAEDYIIFFSFYSKLTFSLLSFHCHPAFRVSNSISLAFFSTRHILFFEGRKRRKKDLWRSALCQWRDTGRESGDNFYRKRYFLFIFRNSVLISLSFFPSLPGCLPPPTVCFRGGQAAAGACQWQKRDVFLLLLSTLCFSAWHNEWKLFLIIFSFYYQQNFRWTDNRLRNKLRDIHVHHENEARRSIEGGKRRPQGRSNNIYFGPRRDGNCFMLRHCLIQCLFIKMPAKISTKEPSIFEYALRVRTWN